MPNLDAVFSECRAVLAPYSSKLDAIRDDEAELYLDTRHRQKNGKALFFGAVQLKKSFVSYHLMPVYLNPALLDSISDELRQRMQGKSCFNFKAPEPALLKELATLTRTAWDDYQRQGYI